MSLGNQAADLTASAATPTTSMPDDTAPVKRRGRPPGSRNKSTANKNKEKEAQNKTVAEMCNRMFFGAVSTVLGESAAPTVEEAKDLDLQLVAYLNSKPDFDLPPGMVLLGAYGMFLGNKIQQQQSARERLKRVGKGVGGMFGRLFSKLKRKGKKNASASS